MPTNINSNTFKYSDRTLFDFRSRMVGGGARPNLFECEIKFPQIAQSGATGQSVNYMSVADTTDYIKFFIKAAQLPGSTIGSIPVPFRGRTLKIAGDRTFDPWTITVINDTSFNLRNAFEQWSNSINRHDDNAGIITPSVYQTDLVVKQLSRGDVSDTTTSTLPRTGDNVKILKAYKLYGCFPTSVDPIPLSYDSTDSIEEFNVTFDVQYWNAFDKSGSILGIEENPTTTTTTPNA